MVDTITPVVHGRSRARWMVTVATHALGATLSAGSLGALLGATGLALRAPWGAAGPLLIAGFAVLYAARETLGLQVPVPERRRQVPDWWRTYFSPSAAAFLYGLGLGVGFLTYQSFGTLTVVSVGALASGDPALGAILVAPFGLARGLSVIAGGRAEPGRDGETVADRLAVVARTGLPKATNGLVLAAVALAAIVAAAARPGGVALADLAAAGLALVFGWAAIGKAVGFPAWRRALSGYGLPGPVEGASLIGAPLLEAAVSLLALLGRQRSAGVLAMVLLLAFSAAILWGRARFGRRLPCGCFGRATQARDYRALLARNSALLGVGLVAMVLGDEPKGPAIWTPASPEELVPVLLSVVGIGLVAWTVRTVLVAFRKERAWPGR